jgi:hypothetical protein
VAALFGDRLLDAWRSRLQALYAADPELSHAARRCVRPSTTSRCPRRRSSSRRSVVGRG